jgi:hypothetical protein
LFEYVEGATSKGNSSASLLTLTLSVQIVEWVISFHFICLFIFLQAREFVCTLKLVRVVKGSLHLMLEWSH